MTCRRPVLLRATILLGVLALALIVPTIASPAAASTRCTGTPFSFPDVDTTPRRSS